MVGIAHGVTLAEVAAIARLNLRIEYAGTGMARPVEAPHVVELANPRHCLNGGELAMTTGALLGEDREAWSSFVTELTDCAAVGLLVGLDPQVGFRRVPGFLVDLARAHDLSLLSAPASTSLASITREVMAAHTTAERAIMQTSFALQLRLTGIVTRGGSVDVLLSEWRRSTGEEAGVFDRVGRLLGKNAGLDPEAVTDCKELLRTHPPPLGHHECLDSNGSTIEIRAFAGETTVRGYLVRADSGLANAQLAVPTLLSLLALEFERRWFLDEPVRRQRSQQLTRLLAIEEDARACAFLRSLGVEASQLWGVVVEARSSTHAEVLIDDLAVVLGTPLLRLREHTLEGLAGSPPRRLLQEYELDVPVGIGTAVSPGGANRTLRQARSAAETSRRTGGLIEFVDGAAHDFLLHVADSSYLAAFADAVLAPIETTANGKVLLETLHVWLREQRSIEACALRLGVHRHTVRNRIHRITQLTGRSLESVDAQTELWLALKARGVRDD